MTDDGVVDAEIHTEVSVALTDTQVSWLRHALDSTRLVGTAVDILGVLAKALPPEPVTITIELPAVACDPLEWGRRHSYPAEQPIELTPGEVTALHEIRSAIRRRNAGA